jgi:hypothetical protein
LKRGLHFDKVTFVSCNPGPILSPDDAQFVEIIAAWGTQLGTQLPGCAGNLHEIIVIALLRLRWELESGSRDEVIEDMRREIAYRLWCAKIEDTK